MQVWLQRTVGCIALSSLVVFFLVQISGGCVGLVGVWVHWMGVQGIVGCLHLLCTKLGLQLPSTTGFSLI